MTRQKKSISGFVFALGGLLVGMPATTALAAEPTTAAEAQAMAQEYRDRADQFRAQGGVGYTTGRVREAETEAARYDALAERLAALPAAAPVTAPEAQRYADQAAHYRAMGGVAYKTGLLQWAEKEERKAAPAPTTTPPMKAPCSVTKPAVQQYDCER